MAIQKFEDDLNIISKLGDNPGTDNGLTTPQFRAMFDKAGLLIQKFINEVILPAMNASNNPQEGLSMQGGINMNGQMLNGIKAPGAADEAANKGYVDDKHFFRTVTLPADGWSAEAPYTQTVAVQGVTGDDAPHVGLIPKGQTKEERDSENEAWDCVSHGVAENGIIVFTCDDEKPATDLALQIEVNR